MSNWFFSAIMDGSGLCIPIRLKNGNFYKSEVHEVKSFQGKKKNLL